MNNKELAKKEWFEMIVHSWTWNRLTDKEKDTFIKLLDHNMSTEIIKGTFKDRWEICGAIYFAYLSGLGYFGNELNWRE